MRLSLRYRLLVPLALLLLGDLAATGWAAAAAAGEVDRRLAAQLWAVAHTLTEPRTFPLTERVLEQMKGLSGAEFLLVRPGGPPFTTLPEGSVAAPPHVPAAVASEDGEHTLGPPVMVGETEYRCLRLSLRPPHPNAGGDLYIFYPESLRRSAVRDAVRPTLVLGGVGGLVALGLALAIGTRLVRRIRDVEYRTRLIAEGEFRPVPLPRTEDELTDLCRSVNDMARRLAEFQDQMQRSERLRVLGQFSGGLAHQMRNAAAGARLAIELFLAENLAVDNEPLEVALRQLVRIEATLRQFLDVGKPAPGLKMPCDLAALLDQTIGLLRPQCLHAGITVKWEHPLEPCVVAGDAGQLGHLFANVIGNAVEAAGPGGLVEVRAPVRRGEYLVIEVADSGPGPPPEIAARLFEPFVTGKEEGIGLGLAVAKQAAESHGGKVSWQRCEGQTVFRIELPANGVAGAKT